MKNVVSMAQRRELRAAVRTAALAMVKRDGLKATAELLGVNPRTIQFWQMGTWPTWPAAKRHAVLLKVKP